MLVTSNFSFSHSVFKRLVSQGCQKVSSCGNGLRKKPCENIVVTSIFSFSHNVFRSKTEIIILATFSLLSANALNLVRAKNCSLVELNLKMMVVCICQLFFSKISVLSSKIFNI